MAFVAIVDDADSRLTYAPDTSWLSENTGILEYKSTTHGLQNGTGTVHFPFNGTRVDVFGTIIGNTTSTVQCTVDGSPIDVESQEKNSETLVHQLLCSSTLSDDKEHSLVITANADNQHPFFLDYILYHLSISSGRSDAPPGSDISLVVDDRSDQVSYSDGWILSGNVEEFDQTTHGTTQEGAFVTFNFQGTKVGAYGTIAKDGGDDWVTGYSIDGQPSISLNSSSFPGIEGIAYNMLLWESPPLSDGQHTLKIDIKSGGLTFWLDYFVYTPSPSVLLSSNSSSSSSSSSTATSPAGSTSNSSSTPTALGTGIPTPSSSSINTGTIGIVVGAAIAVLILACLSFFLLCRRRRRLRSQSTRTHFPIHPPPETRKKLQNIITPFKITPIAREFTSNKASSRVDRKRAAGGVSGAGVNASSSAAAGTSRKPPPYSNVKQ